MRTSIPEFLKIFSLTVLLGALFFLCGYFIGYQMGNMDGRSDLGVYRKPVPVFNVDQATVRPLIATSVPSAMHFDALKKFRCDKLTLVTMLRTRDSAVYIEEVIAYYLAHGSKVVHVIDNSDDESVLDVLRPYILKKLVAYESITAEKIKEPINRIQTSLDGAILSKVAHAYARQAAVHSKPFWLLSVDDDEFVLPNMDFSERSLGKTLDPSTSLCALLGDPRVAAYKSARFRWRFVGSSGITAMPIPDVLCIEEFVKMSERVDAKIGKSAFHLNHENTSINVWIDQDENLINDLGNRRGGPYFMHGNDPKLEGVSKRGATKSFGAHSPPRGHVSDVNYTEGSRDLIELGYTMHYTRSEALNHVKHWKRFAFGEDTHIYYLRAVERYKARNINTVKDTIVSDHWACRVKEVTCAITARSYSNAICKNGKIANCTTYKSP
eukprot:m.111325 g.111325  ORF g.111325 m.111325 type:complete len:439 (+) comp28112_c0_seq1:498-1814(+)